LKGFYVGIILALCNWLFIFLHPARITLQLFIRAKDLVVIVIFLLEALFGLNQVLCIVILVPVKI
jgi:hypothetical protein